MAYRTVQIMIKPEHKLFAYLDDICHKYKNLYNVTNYYIRNTMTGIKKIPNERQHHEIHVLHDVFTNIVKLNDIKDTTLKRKIASVLTSDEPDKEEAITLLKEKQSLFTYPSEKKWFLGYSLIDGILKQISNADYYALPAQVNQNAIRDCIEAWTGYFKTVKAYKVAPSKFRGKPRIPKYKKGPVMTAVFTNVNCKVANDGGTYTL